jgi:hypothetical protein
MANGIRKEDLDDLDIVDSSELASDGYAVYLSSTLISTNSIGNVITIVLPPDGEGLITGRDHLANAGDRVRLTGTSGGLADGYFIINSIVSETSFSVNTSIVSSTGGIIYFMHQVGAKSVGFDPSGLFTITAHNVQDAIKEIALNASGISETTHKTLRHIIHFIDDGPGDGFLSGAYKEILPAANPFPTSVIWWESAAKIKKMLEKEYIYNSNKTVGIASWKIYDTNGVTVLVTVTDTIVYSGVFELNRTRSFS